MDFNKESIITSFVFAKVQCYLQGALTERKMDIQSPCKKLLSLSRWEEMKVRTRLFMVGLKSQMDSQTFKLASMDLVSRYQD